MELPDFTNFGPFNEMRRKLGTDKLGYFELFDPAYHLTGQERSDLARSALEVNVGEMSRLLDFTLVYKNSRVILRDEDCFHLCVCRTFPSDRPTFVVSTSESAFVDDLTVCGDCLQTLHYKGYDATKARKEAYSEQVRKGFRLSEFWSVYTQYPVSEKRDKRRALND